MPQATRIFSITLFLKKWNVIFRKKINFIGLDKIVAELVGAEYFLLVSHSKTLIARSNAYPFAVNMY